MNAENRPFSEGPLAVVEHELARLSKEWFWFFLLGVLLIVSGIIAISYPFMSSVGLVLENGFCHCRLSSLLSKNEA